MLWAFFVFILLSKTVSAQNDDENAFIEPVPPGTPNDFSENTVYVIGSQISLRWRTNYTELSLAIWQNGNASFLYIPGMKFVTTTTSYKWTVEPMSFDLKDGNVFFFDIFAEDGTGRQLSSHYFNISEGAASPSSASASRSSSTSAISSTILSTILSTGLPTSSTPAATTTTTTTLPTATPQVQATSNSPGLSAGAKAGIGVGVSVVGIGAALAALAIVLRHRRRKSKEDAPLPTNWYPMDPPDKSGGSAAGWQDESFAPPKQRQLNPQEMSAISEPHELPGAGFDSPRLDKRSSSSGK